MDVKQALQHDWFTNPAQAAWFKEMYTRSIQGWKPRSSSEPVIVELTSFLGVQLTKRLPSESASSWSPKEGARFADVDHISESSWENVPPGGVKSLISPAISNSVSAKKASDPSPLVSLVQNSANKPRRPQEFAQQVKAKTDVKFISQVKREQIDRPKLERHVLYEPSCESPNVQNTTEKNQPAPRGGKQATKAKFTLSKETGMRNFFLSPGSAAFSPIAHSGTAASQKSSKDDSDESDEVYEEVRNPVTGKRKRLIYGRDMELLSRML
jgi:protein-serine/threonine kinase